MIRVPLERRVLSENDRLAGFEPNRRVAVLTGDIQTDNDAQRLARYGFPVRQITTGGACHLDARMVEKALGEWVPAPINVLFVEDVGNLVCPSSYDLGEEARVVLVVLNKIDLLPYVPFRMDLAREYIRWVQPEAEIVEVSCTTGAGLDTWRQWIEARYAARLT